MRKLYYVGIAVLMIFLVGCAKQQVEPLTTTESTATEVTFGWLGPLTGNLATLGEPIKDAVVLAVEEVNANKVVPGKTFKVLYEDDSCDPKKSSTAVQKFVNVDKVTAIIGPACSGPTLADAPIVEEAKVLTVSYSATNPTIKDAGDYIFRNVPSDANQGVAAAGIVKGLGAKKVAIINIQNDWGVGLKDVFSNEAERLGMKVVAKEQYDPTETDFKTSLAKVKAAKPDAIYMLSFPADGGILLKQISEAGLKVPVVGADGTKDDAVIAAAGKAAEGFIVTLPGVPKSPELEKFTTAFKAKYGKEPSAYTPEAYDVVYILAKACGATDCTSTAMKDYLYKMGEYKGASGNFEFDKNGEVQKDYDYFQVKDGKWAPYSVE